MSVTAPDVLGEVYDFLRAYIKPRPDHIIRGWQNRVALPNNINYAVLTLINAARQGTNVVDWNMPEDEGESAETALVGQKEALASSATGQGTDIVGEATPQVVRTVRMLTLYEVQVDFCGRDEARVIQQAWGLVMLARDIAAVDFFNERGLSSLYADDPRSLPFADDTDQWETRYAVTLRLSGWSRVDIGHDAFTDVDIWLEDVDYHHNP